MEILLVALTLLVFAALLSFAFSCYPLWATRIGVGGALVACSLGIVPVIQVLLGGTTESFRLTLDAAHGVFSVELDALSAFFLLPVLGLSALAAVYGGEYLFSFTPAKSLGGVWFFFNIFIVGMALVVIARSVFLFLLAWEVMSISAYCLVTFEHEKSEVRRAGWIYLVATHLGVVALILAFMLLGRHAGSLEFDAFLRSTNLGAGWAGLIFVLALIGFGAKAGFVPFHVWLPEAHPAAPSHVSALMSGVMIKMGLYGMLRMLTFLDQPAPWWGLTLAGLGLLTSIVGISLAMYQRDIKRMLAYSSIENIGLIAIALGVGLWGSANHHPLVAALGMTAGLLHIWNHTLMKGMMFLVAGSILHGTGVKDMEKLGGLMKRMPWTANTLLLGSVAMAALPPLNGFVSKWLIYLSLMKCGLSPGNSGGLVPFLSVGLLALIGGLAVLAFARMAGIVLLGSPRSNAAQHAHESSPWMVGPMAVLLLFCLAIALVPQLTVGLIHGPLIQLFGKDMGQRLLDLESYVQVMGYLHLSMITVVMMVALALFVWFRRTKAVMEPTWGCAYVQPTARMQYTGRSFAEMIGEHLLPRWLRLRTSRKAPQGLFPVSTHFESNCSDPLLEKAYMPFFHRCATRFSRLRMLQQGKVHVYLVYIVLTVVLALTWVSQRTWWSKL